MGLKGGILTRLYISVLPLSSLFFFGALSFSPALLQAAEPVEDNSSAPAVKFSLFADAYMAYQSGETGSLATTSGHRSYAGQGPNGLAENGFSLSFIGLDATWDNNTVGVTTSLRFGSSVPIFHGNDPAVGIDNITQGYLTWHATEALDVDAGLFGTIFGAEVAESWQNLNYTRGALYYYGQPFWHTGLKASYQLSDMLGITGMLVNGTNNISETVQADAGADQTPSVALQVSVAPSDTLSLVAGGMLAIDREENDDAGFDSFFDVVGTAELGALKLVLNADYLITKSTVEAVDDRSFFGVSVAAGYPLSDSLGIAARVEYLTDNDGTDADAWTLTTGTATLDFKPAPNFIVRVDGRVESSNQDVFGVMPDGDLANASGTWFTGVIGLVVTTDP